MLERHQGVRAPRDVPTGEIASGLSKQEQQVFDAVARRFMAQFYPKHKYIDNKLEADYDSDVFASSWKQTTVQGWKAVDEPHDEGTPRQRIRQRIA
ncbi:DNA topoisomerase [Cupriavidus basilensis]